MNLKKSFKKLKKFANKNKKLIVGAAVVGAGIYFAPAIAGKAGALMKGASKYGSKVKGAYNAGRGTSEAKLPQITTKMYQTILRPQRGRAAEETVTTGNQAALMYGAETEQPGNGPARTVAGGAMMASPMACASVGGTPEFVLSAVIVGAAMVSIILLYKKLAYKKRKVENVRVHGFTR